MELEHTHSPNIKINSLWLKGINRRHDTMKLLENIIGKTFFDIICTHVFSGQSPKAIEIKVKINKWDLIKLTSFCTASESESESRSVVSNSLRPHGLYRPWNSLHQNTGVGSLSLLQGIFPIQR